MCASYKSMFPDAKARIGTLCAPPSTSLQQSNTNRDTSKRQNPSLKETGKWVAASLDDTGACAIIAKGTLGLRPTRKSCLACYANKIVGGATGVNATHLPSSSFHTLGACCTNNS